MTARYTREAGVRQLERTIGNLARKVALKIAAGRTEKVTITAATISKVISGAPRFYPEQARKELPAGVATGMAWTEMGGEVLFIEATLLPGGSGLTMTGQLGEVMQESAQAAAVYLWSHATEFGIDPDVIKAERRSPARSGGRDSEGRPERGRHDGLGARFALHRPKGALGYGDDGRDHAVGFGVSGRRRQGKGSRGASCRHPADHSAGANEADIEDMPEDVRKELEIIPATRVSDVLQAALEEARTASGRKSRCSCETETACSVPASL